MKNSPVFAVLGLLVWWCAGCGSGQYGSVADETSSEIKIVADAYLFDARLRLDGKPRSFRLELYVTDSVVGLSGRGYLGKRVLEGRMTSDSVEAFFPPSDEYIFESVSDLLSTADCESNLPAVNLIRLLSELPSAVLVGDQFMINSSEDRELDFDVTYSGCRWRLGLVFDMMGELSRLKKFSFDNGDRILLKGTRRTFRHGVSVPSNRFVVRSSSSATRIIP